MATATHVTPALPRQLPLQPNGCRSVEGFTTPSGKGLDKGKHRSQQEHHLSRYTKGELIGQGAQKRVYKAFDEELGLEVAWNEVPVAELAWTSEKERDRIFSEIRVLKQLKHKNIIALHDWWFDQRTSTICFITELFTDGTLRQYRRKHRNADLAVLKRWAWQILQGLVYLHAHNPPIIHRDLKSDNIFVNGCSGTVKIGDLGFATMRAGLSMAMSVIGTPEFMAPELYEESYNEKVDVYSFGMCLLELDTLEYPYAECKNAAQIFKKVTSGIAPAGLKKVSCDELRDFISTCICQDPSKRPESRQLLKHRFFDCIRLSTGGGMGTACKSGVSLSSMAPQSRNASPRQSLTGMTSEPRLPLSPTQPAMQPAAVPSPTGLPQPSRPSSQIAEPTTPPNGAGAATTAARQKLPDGARGGLISAALAQPTPKRATHESPAVADSLAQQAYSRRATHTGPAEQQKQAPGSVTPAAADRRVGTAVGALAPAAGTHPAAVRPDAVRRPVELPAPQPSPFLAAIRAQDPGASVCLASATDLDESDILFSNSHMRAPQSGEVELSPCGPHDRRLSMAHSRTHTLSRELLEVWSGSEDSMEEGGIPCRGNGAHAEGDAEQPNVATSVASSLRPDLSMRLNMKCRRTPDDGTLSFSLSFVNHCGLRKKVGFLYNTEEDQPVQIAHEMVENLSLRVDEAAFIAEMLQKQVEEQGGQIQLQVVQEVPGDCQEAANGGCCQEVQQVGVGNWEGAEQQGRRQSVSGSSCCSMGSGSASTCGSNVRASASTPDRAGVGEGAEEPYGEDEEEEEDEDNVPSCFF